MAIGINLKDTTNYYPEDQKIVKYPKAKKLVISLNKSNDYKKGYKDGIQSLLDLGYKSPKEVKKIESKAISHGYDWAKDKW